jgi:hypothetical protein
MKDKAPRPEGRITIMDVTVAQSVLRHALREVTVCAASGRARIEILKNVKLDARPYHALIVQCDNLEEAELRALPAYVVTPGAITVPAKLFRDLVKTFGVDADVRLIGTADPAERRERPEGAVGWCAKTDEYIFDVSDPAHNFANRGDDRCYCGAGNGRFSPDENPASNPALRIEVGDYVGNLRALPADDFPSTEFDPCKHTNVCVPAAFKAEEKPHGFCRDCGEGVDGEHVARLHPERDGSSIYWEGRRRAAPAEPIAVSAHTVRAIAPEKPKTLSKKRQQAMREDLAKLEAKAAKRNARNAPRPPKGGCPVVEF